MLNSDTSWNKNKNRLWLFFFFSWHNQVGVLQYGEVAVHEWSLMDYQTTQEVVDAAKNISRQEGRETRTAYAIHMAWYACQSPHSLSSLVRPPLWKHCRFGRPTGNGRLFTFWWNILMGFFSPNLSWSIFIYNDNQLYFPFSLCDSLITCSSMFLIYSLSRGLD